jgi:hypothetical protein
MANDEECVEKPVERQKEEVVGCLPNEHNFQLAGTFRRDFSYWVVILYCCHCGMMKEKIV